MYNLTYDGAGLAYMLQFVNSINPISTAVFLLFVPFVLFLVILSRFGLNVSLGVSSFFATILSILLASTGLVDAGFIIVFLAFTVIGFIWMSAKS